MNEFRSKIAKLSMVLILVICSLAIFSNKAAAAGIRIRSVTSNANDIWMGSGDKLKATITVEDTILASDGGFLTLWINGEPLPNPYQVKKIIGRPNGLLKVDVQFDHRFFKGGENKVKVEYIARNQRGFEIGRVNENILLEIGLGITIDRLDKETGEKLDTPGTGSEYPSLLEGRDGTHSGTTLGRKYVENKDANYVLVGALVNDVPVDLDLSDLHLAKLSAPIQYERKVNKKVVLLYEQTNMHFLDDRLTSIEKKYNRNDENKETVLVVNEGTDNEYRYKYFFGPYDTPNKKPKTLKESVGEFGEQGNKTGFLVNFLTDFGNGEVTSAYTNFDKDLTGETFQGFSLNKSDSSKNTPFDFDPRYTRIYQSKDTKGNPSAKLVGLLKERQPYYYIAEITATGNKETNKVDITTEIFNYSPEVPEFGLMYSADSHIKGTANGKQLDTRGPTQAVGNNKGVYLETEGSKTGRLVRSTFDFPSPVNNGPSNWTVNKFDKNNVLGFEGFKTKTASSSGLETGYEASDLDYNGGIKKGEPFVPGYIFGNLLKMKYAGATSDANNTIPSSFLKMKSIPKTIDYGESVKMNWSMALDSEMREPPANIFRKLDEDKELENYSIIEKLEPLEIDASSISEITKVSNYIIFGTSTAADTKAKIKSGVRSQNSDINIEYKKDYTSFNFPRIITYPNNNDNVKPTMYSSDYNNKDGLLGNNVLGEGSGFGLITTDVAGTKVDNFTSSIVERTKVDEIYKSKDGKTLKIYGQYYFGNPKNVSNNKIKSIPLKVTVESANHSGKGRFTFQYLNTLETPTTYKSAYTVHMDINGKHKSTEMRTLGNSKGIYFSEKSLSELNNTPYFVGFYTDVSNKGVKPDNINIYDLGNVSQEKTAHTLPVGWSSKGNDVMSQMPQFIDQKRGEVLTRRDNKGNGAVLSTQFEHPAWLFSYPSQTLGENEVGRSDIELKVSDLPDLSYSPTKINVQAGDKTEGVHSINYRTIVEQTMDAEMESKIYRVSPFKITINNGSLNQDIEKNTIITINNQPIDKVKYPYDIVKGNESSTYDLVFKDLVPWELKDNAQVKLVQETNLDIEDLKPGTDRHKSLMDSYDFDKKEFEFKVSAFNSWGIFGDDDKSGGTQTTPAKATYKMPFEPNINAKAKINKTVMLGTKIEQKDAKEFVTMMDEPDISWDENEVSFVSMPDTSKEGNQIVNIKVSSKYFKNEKIIPVEITVINQVSMTVKNLLVSSSGNTETLKDLDKGLEVVKDDVKKVDANGKLSNVVEEYKKLSRKGYSLSSIKILHNGQELTEASDIPSSDFTLELYYKGAVTMTVPKTIDFGSHKVSVFSKDKVRPSEKGKPVDTDASIINTQGDGGNWSLSVQLTKPLQNKGVPFKGSLYYISNKGGIPVPLEENSLVSIKKSGSDTSILNKVVLGSKEAKSDVGIFMKINPGNKVGEYTQGEMTWELKDAK